MLNQKPILGRGVHWGHPLAQGLAACWLLNEGRGNRIFDLRRCNPMDPFTGDPLWTKGKFGPALLFDGLDDTVSGTATALPTGSRDRTILAWICPSITQIDKACIAWGSRINYQLSYLGMSNTGAQTGIYAAFGDNLSTTAGAVPNGRWTQLVAVITRTTQTLYVNGQWNAARASAGVPNTTGVALNIGSNGSAYYFNGQIDHILVWSRALSGAEIAWLYAAPFVLFERNAPELRVALPSASTWKEAAGTIAGTTSLVVPQANLTQVGSGPVAAQSSLTGDMKTTFVWAEGTATMSGSSSVAGNLILGATVPTTVGGYDFAADPHCLSLYDGETWTTYLDDQKGTDDWQCYPRVNTTDFKEGDGAIEFNHDNRVAYLSFNDANLPTTFPGKAGYAQTSVSMVFWFKAHTLPGLAHVHGLIGKADGTTGYGVEIYGNKITWFGNDWLQDIAQTTSLVTANVWYHVGVTYNSADKSYRIRVYDTSTSSNWADKTGTFTEGVVVNAVPFAIGGGLPMVSQDYNHDGLMDDVAVFNDVLSAAEIDQCRAGTYNYALDGNCVAHWSFDTSNLLTEDINTLEPDTFTAPRLDTTIYKTGSASFRFYGTNSECGYRMDSALSAPYPYKASTSNLEWGTCFWVRFDTVQRCYLVTKYINAGTGSAGVGVESKSGTGYVITLQVRYGATSSDTYQHSEALLPSVWYHVVVNVSASANTYNISVWNDDTETKTVVNGALLHDPIVSVESWKYGALQWTTSPIGLDGWMDEIAQFDAPILIPDEIRAEGAQWAQSSLSASVSQTYNAAGLIQGLSSLLARIQVKQHYLPAQLLEEPFPVPCLWQYRRPGFTEAEAVDIWSQELVKYTEEHLRRIMRELKRLGAEKQSDWVDV